MQKVNSEDRQSMKLEEQWVLPKISEVDGNFSNHKWL